MWLDRKIVIFSLPSLNLETFKYSTAKLKPGILNISQKSFGKACNLGLGEKIKSLF